MKYLFIFLFIASVMPDAFATSTEKSTSWVDKSISIRDISNKQKQAEAWGMCSAVYKKASELMETESSEAAKIFSTRANEAAIVAGMVYIDKGEAAIAAAAFAAGVVHIDKGKDWIPYTEEQKQAMQSMSQNIPEVQFNIIMADLDVLGWDIWFDKFSVTLEFCISNLDGQQFYIDFWRELASSGLLKLK